MSLHLFSRDAEGGYVLDDEATERRLVCRAGNPFGLPAKDRSGRLDVTEPPDLGALLAKINTPTAADGRCTAQPPNIQNRRTTMYDMNDAEPQMAPIGELIPDGTFAKVTMTIRPGGMNGATPIDAGLLKASQIERRQDARLRVHRGRRAVRPAQVLAECSPSRAASSTRRVSRRAGTSPRAPSAP